MPWAPRKPCGRPGCGNLRPCPTHSEPVDRGTAAERGYGAAWRRLRLAVLRREPLCRVCRKAGRVEPATDVDHLIPRARGGTDAWENLQPLCSKCHKRKTIAEAPPRRPAAS